MNSRQGFEPKESGPSYELVPRQAPRTEGESLGGPGQPCPRLWIRAPSMPKTEGVTKLTLTCCLSGEVSHIRGTRKPVLKLACKQGASALLAEG